MLRIIKIIILLGGCKKSSFLEVRLLQSFIYLRKLSFVNNVLHFIRKIKKINLKD